MWLAEEPNYLTSGAVQFDFLVVFTLENRPSPLPLGKGMEKDQPQQWVKTDAIPVNAMFAFFAVCFFCSRYNSSAELQTRSGCVIVHLRPDGGCHSVCMLSAVSARVRVLRCASHHSLVALPAVGR